MMRIHVEQIPERGLNLEFEEPAQTFPALAELTAAGECIFTAPIKSALRARRFDAMVHLTGKVATRARLTCARCLKAFDAPLASRFEVIYTHRSADQTSQDHQEEIELEAADMGVVYFEGEQIDLLETIQEQIVLALPIKALCSPTCRGLCPACGADRNAEECRCDRRASGNAFAALKSLKLDNQ